MSPEWYDAEGNAYCEEHAPEDMEGDLSAGETDVPCNCKVCGKRCNYTLTRAGVQYVMDAVVEACDEIRFKDRSPNKADLVVRAWADDLASNYGLSAKDTYLVQHFLLDVITNEQAEEIRRDDADGARGPAEPGHPEDEAPAHAG